MKKINERFYETDNGLVFDVDTNSVVRPISTMLHKVVDELSFYGEHLNRDVLSKSSYSDGSNFAINLNLTSACNLNCSYCFARGGDYGEVKDNMSKQILPLLKELILKNVTKSQKVRFEYFGGEPLLNENMVLALVEFAKMLENETGIHVLHRVSTNLTLLSEQLLDVICENNFVVSVSIDGTKNVQDIQRPTKSGGSSYDIILHNVKKIKDKNPSIKTVARMTVAQKDVTIFENISNLVSTGLFNYVSLYPATISNSTGKSNKYFFDEEIKEQYREVFRRYQEICALSKDFRGFLEVEKILDMILNGKISVGHCSAGGNYCTLSSDGSIVTCHRLCGQKKFILNTGTPGELNPTLRNYWTRHVDEDPICSKCFARYVCGGGCKHEHISATGNFEEKNKIACAYRMFFLEEIISNIDNLSKGFKERYLPIDDMFVFCGRPVVNNYRNKLPNNEIFCFYDMQKR